MFFDLTFFLIQQTPRQTFENLSGFLICGGSKPPPCGEMVNILMRRSLFVGVFYIYIIIFIRRSLNSFAVS